MPEPQHSTGRTLAHICRLHHARIHTLLESIGLYRGQPPLLFALWQRDGQTHSELAHHLHIKPATISRMIQRMEKSGFLERRPDAEDQRVSRVFLTTAGHDIRTQVQEIFDQIEAELVKDFSSGELEDFNIFLQRVNQNLELTNSE